MLQVLKWGLLVVSSVLLFFGLTEPIVRITLSFEGVLKDTINQNPIIGVMLQQQGLDVPTVLQLLPPDTVVYQSIISSITELFNTGAYLAAAIILVFSVLFPVLKQAVLLVELLRSNWLPGWVSKSVKQIHRWAMIDVFVVSSVVIVLSNAPAWSSSLQAGFLWFVAYFFSSAALMILIGRTQVEEEAI